MNRLHPVPITVGTATVRETPEGLQVELPGKIYKARMPLTDFAGELDPAYMAEQFLRWNPEHAEDVLRGLSFQDKEPLSKKLPACRSAEKWREYLPDHDPLAGYDPLELNTLTEIHEAFRTLVKASYRVLDGRLIPRV